MCTRLLDRRAASSLTPSRSRPQLHRPTSPTHAAASHHVADQFDSRGLRRRRHGTTLQSLTHSTQLSHRTVSTTLYPSPFVPCALACLDRRAASSLTPSRSRPQLHRPTSPTHAAASHHVADQFDSRGLRRRRHGTTPPLNQNVSQRHLNTTGIHNKRRLESGPNRLSKSVPNLIELLSNAALGHPQVGRVKRVEELIDSVSRRSAPG